MFVVENTLNKPHVSFILSSAEFDLYHIYIISYLHTPLTDKYSNVAINKWDSRSIRKWVFLLEISIKNNNQQLKRVSFNRNHRCWSRQLILTITTNLGECHYIQSRLNPIKVLFVGVRSDKVPKRMWWIGTMLCLWPRYLHTAQIMHITVMTWWETIIVSSNIHFPMFCPSFWQMAEVWSQYGY